MKKLVFLMMILCIGIGTLKAQFNLKGFIKNYDGKPLSLNIPQVYGFAKENTISIPVRQDGFFSIDLPISEIKFSNLIFQRTFFPLLLSPNQNIEISLQQSDTTMVIKNGSAKLENQVLQNIKLEEFPKFMQQGNVFQNWTFDQIKAKVIAPYYQKRDQKIEVVRQSNLSNPYKNLLVSELNYISYNYLNDFSRVAVSNKKLTDSLIVYIFDQTKKVDLDQPGPQYYMFVRNYLNYLETKAFLTTKPDQMKKGELIPYFGITIDSATYLVKNFGKPYWRWVGNNRNFPPRVVEHYTYQELLNLFNSKDFSAFKGLAHAYYATFPASLYLESIKNKESELLANLARNQTNDRIKIFEHYEKVSSIYDVIKTLRGKVVYLDVWGTWCGPCKEELKYTPELKKRFEKDDVVFVYLDMDEDDRDAQWKDFIKVNEMTGIHLRKNRQSIEPFWKELLANAADKAAYYPQYFIFDKTGRLVLSKANRPSEKEALYDQIASYLTQK